MQGRDAYAAVALAWVALTLTGAFPYLLSDTIPSFVDALFETASGLTTTGATILDSVETMPPSILFWRSETQWMGGMGVLVLFLALTPHLGDGAYYLMKAESPGPIKSKLVPRVGGTAKILYTIYIVLTAAEAVALRIAGMSWFDAVNHSFTTMATGGFSVRNTSIAEYQSDAITWVIVAFTFLAGINFSLLYAVVRGRIKDALRSEELRWYLLILAATIGLICVDLHVELGQGWYESVTDAAFQATTIMSTTGLRHQGLHPVAHLQPVYSGAADVCGRLRRFHSRRHEDQPPDAAGQEPAAGAGSHHPPQPGVGYHHGRPERGRAGRQFRPHVSGGVPADPDGRYAGGFAGCAGLHGVLCGIADLYQQCWSVAGCSWPHG